ncbi:MAG: hypothetical protein J2P21_04235 [Chloracidobacterium sp.]|nr:hypothetical protein [Chloracidobacterium sp.]
MGNGAYRLQGDFPERAVFVIGAERTIGWSRLSTHGVKAGAEGVLETRDALDAKRKVAA